MHLLTSKRRPILFKKQPMWPKVLHACVNFNSGYTVSSYTVHMVLSLKVLAWRLLSETLTSILMVGPTNLGVQTRYTDMCSDF